MKQQENDHLDQGKGVSQGSDSRFGVLTERTVVHQNKEDGEVGRWVRSINTFILQIGNQTQNLLLVFFWEGCIREVFWKEHIRLRLKKDYFYSY